MARILIVEDEVTVLVLAESVLEEHGHETLSASTAEQALAVLETDQKIDLLFTDLGLQADLQAGLKLAQDAQKRVPGLPVLYASGQEVTDGMKALFVEPFSFLSKPYRADQLIIEVENLINQNRA